MGRIRGAAQQRAHDAAEDRPARGAPAPSGDEVHESARMPLAGRGEECRHVGLRLDRAEAMKVERFVGGAVAGIERVARLPARARSRGAQAGTSEGAASGIRSSNVEPTPTSLFTTMSPPIMRASRRLMARPRPTPPCERV